MERPLRKARELLARLFNVVPRYVKHVIVFSFGYPNFTRAYIELNVRPLAATPAELRHWEPQRWAPKAQLLLVLSSALYILRAPLWALFAFTRLNFNQPAANVRQIAPGLYQFNCFVSNCTRRLLAEWAPLGAAAAAAHEDNNYEGHDGDRELLGKLLLQLPHAQLCHPTLGAVSDAAQHLGPLGMLITGTCCVTLLIAGLFTPLAQFLQYNWTTRDLLIMFLVAPKTSRRLLERRTLQLAREMESSLQVFCSINRREPAGADAPFLEMARGRPQRRPRPRRMRAVASSAEDAILAFRTLAHDRSTASLSYMSKDYFDFFPAALRSADWRPAAQRRRRARWPGQNAASQAPAPPPSGYLEAFSHDCISVVRGEWWRVQMRANLAYMIAGTAALLLPIFLASPPLVFAQMRQHQRELNALGAHLRRQGACNIWLHHNQLDATAAAAAATARFSWRPLDLERLELAASLPLTLVYVLQMAWPIVAIGVLINLYLLTTAELTCHLYELKFQLRLALEIVRQIMLREREAENSLVAVAHHRIVVRHSDSDSDDPLQRHQQRQRFPLELLRNRFKRVLSLFYFIVGCKLLDDEDQDDDDDGAAAAAPSFLPHFGRLGTRSRLKSALATRALVERLVRERQLDLEAAIELLGKLYVSLRILLESLREYSHSMTFMVVMSNIYTYGVVIISIGFLKRIHDFVTLPSLLMLTSWATSNLLIVTASNLHAKGKELHRLIWTLLALLCTCNDVRVRHLHALWARQVQALDADGGLALRALGVRITYTRILQLIIGSGTILVFSLR